MNDEDVQRKRKAGWDRGGFTNELARHFIYAIKDRKERGIYKIPDACCNRTEYR